MRTKENKLTWSAVILAALFAIGLFGLFFYGMMTTILPLIEKMNSPFWGTVLFCGLLCLEIWAVLVFYHLVSKRFSEEASDI